MLLPPPSLATLMTAFSANVATAAMLIRNQAEIAAAQYTIWRSIGLTPQEGRYIQ